MPSPQFTDAEILEIRYQHSRGRLDVKMWADAKMCSLESVRRVARGETYRHLAGVKAHPTYGGLHGAKPAVPAFVPSSEPSGLASLVDEPDADEAAASFARLQAALAQPVPGDAQASAAATLLDELQSKGEAQRPPKTGDELG